MAASGGRPPLRPFRRLSGLLLGRGAGARREAGGSEPNWVRGSGQAVLARLRASAVVQPDFLSLEEEETLSRELEPQLRRRRYQFDHWDAAIHGFRETEKSRWSEPSRAILQRVRAAAFDPDQPQLPLVHVLDLDQSGYIKPHVDSIKFCGSTIAGLSLLSTSVMRLVDSHDPQQWLELLLERRSLYILRRIFALAQSHLPQPQRVFKTLEHCL
ncbi:alpha-ketoglutarate-dependent dioxygenase alkB homolog 7, mitochondrial isoform X3 [Ornithorhynchus anatinus]|uniref:alpha-ketoglutarate-dependent dioxygenase alkB homolog 7, mitochondrial isoform X3 n=1 Tax=Ornithorhynchus anatinus TaxID=9258 RepID=UPI0010A8B829|nr:alpha-ketoglutarate-dependent dioxygenase alkB homolog 7, mitochondrial isoform X3 [Ornithorhynchus anatinus]